MVVGPAAANGKREGPISGGDSAGKTTLTQLYLLPLMPPGSLHLPNYMNLLHMPFMGGKSGDTKQKT